MTTPTEVFVEFREDDTPEEEAAVSSPDEFTQKHKDDNAEEVEPDSLDKEAIVDNASYPEEAEQDLYSVPPDERYEKWAVGSMDAKSVKMLYGQGKLSANDRDKYLTERKINDDFWNMTPKEIKFAKANGLLSQKEVGHWIANNADPTLFSAKDQAGAVVHGLTKMAESVLEVGNDILEAIVNPIGTYTGDKWNLINVKASQEWHDNFKPVTTAGKVISPISQFVAPFLGEAAVYAKATGGVNLSTKLLSSKSGKALMAKAPKLAKFLAMNVENAAIGMGTDYVAFDPYEPAITELLDDMGVLPDYMRFMKADHDDPIAIARLKRSVEGAAVGMGVGMIAKVIFGGLKWIKANSLRNKFGNADDLAKDGFKVEVTPQEIPAKSAKEIDKETLEAEEEMIKSKLNRGDVDGAERIRQKRLETEELRKERGGKETPPEETALFPLSGKTRAEARAAQKELEKPLAEREWMVKNEEGHWDYDTSLNFEKVHEPDDVISMIKFQTKQHATEVRKVKGDTLTTVKLDAEAAAISKQLGKGSPSSALKYAEQKLGFGGLHEAAQFLNGLADYILKLEKEAAAIMDKPEKVASDMLKVRYLIEMEGQLLKYWDTAATDAGRLLWSFKRAKKAGMNMMNLSKDELDELAGMTDKDKLIEFYHQLKGTKHKRKLATRIATSRVQEGILEFVQATLVWGINTFQVNLVGNVMAMGMHGIAHAAGVTADAARHLDWGRMGELNASIRGLGFGIADSLRMVRGEKLGKVWKVAKTGDAQLDASAKFEGQNLHVLKYYAHRAAKGIDKALHLPKKFQLADHGINLGDAYTLSFRGLTMTDELFKNMNYNAQKNAAIFRESYKKYGKGMDDLRNAEIAKLNKDLPDSIHKEAWDIARQNTFTDTPSIVSRKILQAANLQTKALQFGKNPYVFKPLFWTRMVALPFVNIADNLIRFSARYSPFNFVGAKWRKAYAKGGAERAEMLARTAVGTSLMLGGYYLHDSGKMTASVPRGEKGTSLYKNWRNRNVTPHSLIDRCNRRITSITKFAPGALLVVAGANISSLVSTWAMREELEIDLMKFATHCMLPALIDPILEQHYIKSVKDVFDIFSQPDRMDVGKALRNQIPKVMPLSMMIMQARQTFLDLGWSKAQGDAWVKEAHTILDKIKSVYAPDSLLPLRHTIYGTKVPMVAKDWGALAVGAKQRETDAFTPGTVEHEMGLIQLNTGKMSNRIAINTYLPAAELTPHEYDELLEYVEKRDMKTLLAEEIKKEAYTKMSHTTALGRQVKREILTTVINLVREGAKGDFIKANPAWLKAQTDALSMRNEEMKAANTKLAKDKANKSKIQNKNMKEFLEENGK